MRQAAGEVHTICEGTRDNTANGLVLVLHMSGMRIANVLYAMLVLSGLGQAVAELKNVALNKPAAQKDTNEDWYAGRAVDGILQQKEDDNTQTGTFSWTKTWWVVDLLSDYNIQSISIQNNQDPSNILADFYVYVSGSNPVPALTNDDPTTGNLCVHYADQLPSGDLVKLDCDSGNTKGRYVYVWKPANSMLSMCEVQVWAATSQRISSQSRIAQPGYYKSTIPPSKSFTTASVVDCNLACMSSYGGNYFQWNFVHGMCHCIQYSDVIRESDLGLTEEYGWRLWAMDVWSE